MNASPSPVLHERQTGVLLHPTSLPGPHGIGDLGPEARAFVDWLASAGVRLWEVLPLNPPQGQVPYASWSALAGHPDLISLEDLHADGLLDREDVAPAGLPEGRVDFFRAPAWKAERLRRAADRLLDGPAHPLQEALAAFRAAAPWARETALYAALRARHGQQPWWRWPTPLRDAEPAALREAAAALERGVARGVALQFLFERQWAALRRHAAARGVRLLGDVPIYVAHDSADVWAHQEAFRLAPGGALAAVTGAPPDEFTSEGQWWGGPLYAWDRMAEDDYAWWRSRLARAFEHADAVRLDHFRAFSAAWEIPAGAHRPSEGRWGAGPGLRFFEVVRRHLGDLALCAEDLGAIDDDVIALRDTVGLPGMRILHYAFGGGADNPHLPDRHPENALTYPANHDNDTTAGWWNRLGAPARAHACQVLGTDGDDIAWDLNRAALASRARVAILQMQDLLGLGSEARMNDPESYAAGRAHLNWSWRLLPGQADVATAERLRALGERHGRCRAPAPRA